MNSDGHGFRRASRQGRTWRWVTGRKGSVLSFFGFRIREGIASNEFDGLDVLVIDDGVWVSDQALQRRYGGACLVTHLTQVEGDYFAHLTGFVGHSRCEGWHSGFSDLSQDPQRPGCNAKVFSVDEGTAEFREGGGCFCAKDYKRFSGARSARAIWIIDYLWPQGLESMECARELLQEFPSAWAVAAGPVSEEECGVCSHLVERRANGLLHGVRRPTVWGIRVSEPFDPVTERLSFVGGLCRPQFKGEDGDQDESRGNNADEERSPFSHAPDYASNRRK